MSDLVADIETPPEDHRRPGIDRRLILIGLLTLFVGLTFWLGSRVPNLNQKAIMGPDAGIEALGFDRGFAIEGGDGYVIRVLKTSVNWADTNKRGMTFGVRFAQVGNR